MLCPEGNRAVLSEAGEWSRQTLGEGRQGKEPKYMLPRLERGQTPGDLSLCRIMRKEPCHTDRTKTWSENLRRKGKRRSIPRRSLLHPFEQLQKRQAKKRHTLRAGKSGKRRLRKRGLKWGGCRKAPRKQGSLIWSCRIYLWETLGIGRRTCPPARPGMEQGRKPGARRQMHWKKRNFPRTTTPSNTERMRQPKNAGRFRGLRLPPWRP